MYRPSVKGIAVSVSRDGGGPDIKKPPTALAVRGSSKQVNGAIQNPDALLAVSAS